MKPVTIPFFISHQGCPHTCVFCDQRVISGAGGMLPSAAEIDSKITQWSKTAGGRPLEAAFFGGTFTALPRNIQEQLLVPLQLHLSSGALGSVRISTRPDCIDAAHVAWLSERGVRVIELGVQSLDDEVLDLSGRGHRAADSLAAIKCIKNSGLRAGVQLMPGLPGDTPAVSLASLEQSIAAGADFLRIYPTVVLQGTELARRFAAGEFVPLSFERGILLSKILLQRAMRAEVPVIRIGLQADQHLNADTILAGCWHPSLGQLVRSRLYADLINKLAAPERGTVTVTCHPSRYSDVAGMKRSTIRGLADRGVRMQIYSDASLAPEKFKVIHNETNVSCSIITDINYSIDEV